MTLLRDMDVESMLKKPRVSWVILLDAFLTKLKEKRKRKRTILLYRNKLDERIHAHKSSKYAIKEKLTTILGS